MIVMEDMLKDFLLGEHLLLVGNQVSYVWLELRGSFTFYTLELPQSINHHSVTHQVMSIIPHKG